MKEIFKIAIDGPSGAGKSTIAKAVAKRLGIDYIDTGAMYRAIGLKMTRLNLPMEESEALQQMLEETDIDFNAGDVILDDVVVNDLIRTPEMSMAASACSALGMVRAKLVELQKELLKLANSKKDYNGIADEIYRLRELKQNVLVESAEREGVKQRIKEMQEFLDSQATEVLEYDEQLVQRLIEKVTVYEERFEVEFKSGAKVDVER